MYISGGGGVVEGVGFVGSIRSVCVRFLVGLDLACCTLSRAGFSPHSAVEINLISLRMTRQPDSQRAKHVGAGYKRHTGPCTDLQLHPKDPCCANDGLKTSTWMHSIFGWLVGWNHAYLHLAGDDDADGGDDNGK